jgi:subtilisin-like proprotein convertase family protein
MNKTTLALSAVCLLGLQLAKADFSTTTYNSGFNNGGLVPDGSITGWTDTRALTTGFNSMTDVNVRLTLSGGYNGDLYAYLVHSSGFTVLLNRVGLSPGNPTGYSNPGMNVTFDDQASGTYDIHFYQSQAGYNILGGTAWRPDGRNIDPRSSGATFSATSPTALLGSFNGINPNGSWTLFLADLSPGAQTTVTSWGLDITGVSVPEPRSLLEGSVAALLVGLGLGLYQLKKVKTQIWPA